MTIEQAAKETGYAPFTLRMFARQGEFVASKPKGDRHGWQISEGSFRQWWKDRQSKGSNEAARAARREAK